TECAENRTARARCAGGWPRSRCRGLGGRSESRTWWSCRRIIDSARKWSPEPAGAGPDPACADNLAPTPELDALATGHRAAVRQERDDRVGRVRFVGDHDE